MGATRAATGKFEARKTTLNGILNGESSSDGPQSELESAEDSDGARGAADGAAAEEQLGEEDTEGNEASKVEENVRHLERQNGPGVVNWECVRMVGSVSCVFTRVVKNSLHLGKNLGTTSR